MSEIHGMSQRGGAVSSQIRYGTEAVFSPVIGKGEADVLVSFEEMEAMRWLEYCKKEGVAVVNRCQIPPQPVLSGKVAYPQGLTEDLKQQMKTFVVDASQAAEALGNGRVANLVMLGALVRLLDLNDIDWAEIISRSVKKEFVELNLQAFEKGKEILPE